MKAFEDMLFREHVLSDFLPHLHNKNDNVHKLFFTSSQNSTFSLIDNKLDIQMLNVISDNNGGYVIMECIIQRMKLIMANVYLPVRGRESERNNFWSILKK